VPDAIPPFWTYWYEQGDYKNLRQGDILRGVTVLWFPQNLSIDEEVLAKPASEEGPGIEVEWTKGDWIVCTASCDMDNNRNAQVLLGRIIEVTQANLKTPNQDEFKQMVEVLKRGLYPSRFLLAEFEDSNPRFPRSVVDFRFQVQMPIQYLLRVAPSPRLRMKSPLREQFGNWVGACISRVGPENVTLIPKEKLFPPQTLRAVDADAPSGPTSEQRIVIRRPSAETQG